MGEQGEASARKGVDVGGTVVSVAVPAAVAANADSAAMANAILTDALLRAADQAGIGTTVTVERRDGRFENVFVNEAALAMNGYERHEFMGLQPDSLLASGEAKRLLVDRQIPEVGGIGRIETTLVSKTGEHIPIECAIVKLPWPDAEGGTAIVSYFSDLRDRLRAQEALRQSEANLRKLIENAPEGIAIIQDGRFVFANSVACKMLGFETLAEVRDLPLSDTIVPEEMPLFRERIAAMMREGKRFPPREYTRVRPDGSTIVAETTSMPFEYEGRPAILAFTRDMTEHRRLADRVARVEKLVVLGTIAAGVAHEINNPLAVTTTSLEAIERMLEDPSTPEWRERALSLIRDARAGTERVSTIVRDLRGLSRDGEERAYVDVSEVLAAAERMADNALRGRTRVVRTQRDLPRVHANAQRLEQVFVNLFVNAAQAMPDTRQAADNVINIDALEDDGRVIVTVQDNGVGIAPGEAGRIFDPFYTTKPRGEGTGLGLSISLSIVEKLGGSLSVESSVGVGTTFKVVLPVESAPPSRARAVTPKRARILVVDDEPVLVRTLVTLLGEDHEVVGAMSGAEALHLLSGDDEFDLVLCDLMMPYVTGMDLYERLAREKPGAEHKLVFMTGGAFTARARDFLTKVPNARIDKPFSPGAVNAVLAKVRAR